MPVLPISDLDDPRVAWYRGTGDPELLRRGGRFVAEGRQVVRRLLGSGRFAVESVLVTPPALAALAQDLERHGADLPVYLVAAELMVELTGFNIHRGCLAVGLRPPDGSPGQVVPAAPAPALVVVLERAANADNVGGVFRNARAFGAAAVLLDPSSCDPLYRKAIRTSMGAALEVPVARVTPWPGGLAQLREQGLRILALDPGERGVDIGASVDLLGAPRVALLVGNEGVGLSDEARAVADAQLRIPMAPGVDSLNLATATGIALYVAAEARRHRGRAGSTPRAT
jgi:tRNA G18 (ribose-2'-O)-methylase SpoU